MSTGGPFAAALDRETDNLVLRAARLLAGEERVARLSLRKNLPVASGIGGGSADAAAALRLLSRLWSVPLPPPQALTALGADVPVCLASRPARMRGIGERLDPLRLPRFWLVLVNVDRPVSTAAVFQRLARRENPPLPEPPSFGDAADLAAWLVALTRNDLQEAACSLEPTILDALAALARLPGCLLARMSGSGATCFGLFATAAQAGEAAKAISQARPGWWVSAGESRPEGPLPGGPR